jgi:hypothetical protein
VPLAEREMSGMKVQCACVRARRVQGKAEHGEVGRREEGVAWGGRSRRGVCS